MDRTSTLSELELKWSEIEKCDRDAKQQNVEYMSWLYTLDNGNRRDDAIVTPEERIMNGYSAFQNMLQNGDVMIVRGDLANGIEEPIGHNARIEDMSDSDESFNGNGNTNNAPIDIEQNAEAHDAAAETGIAEPVEIDTSSADAILEKGMTTDEIMEYRLNQIRSRLEQNRMN